MAPRCRSSPARYGGRGTGKDGPAASSWPMRPAVSIWVSPAHSPATAERWSSPTSTHRSPAATPAPTSPRGHDVLGVTIDVSNEDDIDGRAAHTEHHCGHLGTVHRKRRRRHIITHLGDLPAARGDDTRKGRARSNRLRPVATHRGDRAAASRANGRIGCRIHEMLDVPNSGTTMRYLTAASSQVRSAPGTIRTCDRRIRSRLSTVRRVPSCAV